MSIFNRSLEKDTTFLKRQASYHTPVIKTAEYEEIESKIHTYLLDELKKIPIQSEEQERTKIRELGEQFLNNEGDRLTFEEKEEILSMVQYELLAYGPITPLLENPTISEIMVNGADQIYYEQDGRLNKSHISFRDNQHVSRVLEKIVSPMGRRVDESSPMVDARLPDGSRVNAIIPPLALKGPTLTIRKFSETPFHIHDLIQFGTLSEEMAEFLDVCVKARLNIFISGGTGSGKTSSLNVLSSFYSE